MLRFATRPCPALRQSTNIIRPSLKINSLRLHATGSPKRLADAKSLSFARPTPFAHRLNKLIAQSRPFRRSYSSPNDHGNMPASYKSAKRAVRTLILINTGVFLTWAYASGHAHQTNDTKLLQSLVRNFMLTEENLAQGRYHTLITSAFSHSNFWHFGISKSATQQNILSPLRTTIIARIRTKTMQTCSRSGHSAAYSRTCQPLAQDISTSSR